MSSLLDHLPSLPLFKPYSPKNGEEYMSEKQLEHFHSILVNWGKMLGEYADSTVSHLRDDAEKYADTLDRAIMEESMSVELRTRDRERKLLGRIHQALQQLHNGGYGYCSNCKGEIGLRRLEARPITERCLSCQSAEESEGN